jgi:hypothetical protein
MRLTGVGLEEAGREAGSDRLIGRCETPASGVDRQTHDDLYLPGIAYRLYRDISFYILSVVSLPVWMPNSWSHGSEMQAHRASPEQYPTKTARTPTNQPPYRALTAKNILPIFHRRLVMDQASPSMNAKLQGQYAT